MGYIPHQPPFLRQYHFTVFSLPVAPFQAKFVIFFLRRSMLGIPIVLLTNPNHPAVAYNSDHENLSPYTPYISSGSNQNCK